MQASSNPDPNKIQPIDIAFALMAFAPLAIFIGLTLFSAWTWLALPLLAWWELKTFKAYSLNLEQRKNYA